jgi:hypothetical protein
MASRSKKDSSTSKNGASYLKNPKLANSIKKTSACSIVSQVRESDGIISNIHIYIFISTFIDRTFYAESPR